MTLKRDEIVTGVLVIVTLAVLVAVVLALGSPGLFHKLNTYSVLFDNAGGVLPGTQVFLSGRKVGQVSDVQSPVPLGQRPPEHQDFEALIEVQVSGNAQIYRSVTVRMQQYGWFGTQIIDFVKGDEQSGLAPSGTTFVGQRVASFTEVSERANAALNEMTATLGNIKELTSEGGDLRQTAANARDFSDTIKHEPWRLIWRSHKHYPGEPEEEEDHRSRPKERRPTSRKSREKP